LAALRNIIQLFLQQETELPNANTFFGGHLFGIVLFIPTTFVKRSDHATSLFVDGTDIEIDVGFECCMYMIVEGSQLTVTRL